MYLLQNRLRPVWTGFLRFFAVLVRGPWFLKLSGTGPVCGLSPKGLRTGTGPDLEALYLLISYNFNLWKKKTIYYVRYCNIVGLKKEEQWKARVFIPHRAVHGPSRACEYIPKVVHHTFAHSVLADHTFVTLSHNWWWWSTFQNPCYKIVIIYHPIKCLVALSQSKP